LIFQHGLLLSEKFFITNTQIAKKYKAKATKNKRKSKKRNFLEKNIKNASTPVIKNPGKKKFSSPAFLKKQQNNYMKARLSGGLPNHGTPREMVNIRVGKPKKNKRVKSAFGNPYKEVPQMDKGKFLSIIPLFRSD